ncbi:MAG TPA: DUF4831 family protein [Bacteroidales bacterium]|nr:DUF4831 family protein [Bacteroidales bacterium]HPE22713.1 DUF4831 family protein [Bacteroidales bacterium]
MRRKTALLLTVVFILAAGCTATKPHNDIVVLPLGGEARMTEGCLVYALPLTVFEFDVIAEKRVEIPGPYAQYAGEMTGLESVIKEKNESWSLTEVRLNTLEELDPSQFYIIQGTSLMQTNMLALRKSGLVLDINPEAYDHALYSDLKSGTDHTGLLFPDRGAYEYVSTRTDTAYRLVKVDTAFIRVPYLIQRKQGMTLEQEAREAADRLFELREGRHMILTGETNIFPQDGAAIDEINRLETEYTALFAGKIWTEVKHFRISVTPDLSMAGRKTAVFFFSGTGGINTDPVEGGTPVEMEIIPSGKTRELELVVRPVTSQKELAANDRLYYRVPDVAEITVTMGAERVCSARKLVYQFGNKVALPSNFIIGK